jgi:hypothetical protein
MVIRYLTSIGFSVALAVHAVSAFAPLSPTTRHHGLVTGDTRSIRRYRDATHFVDTHRLDRTGGSTTALGYGELRGVDAQLLFDTWEWTAGLGAPAALVAGAVLATMYESREEMSPRKSDTRWIRIAKKACRFLLLSSFGLEVVSIFVTTVTGTMLLAHGDAATLGNMNFNSPLGFLRANWEFEYLTARIAFLLGLFTWLASVALELVIPKRREGVAARRMNQFTASSLVTILVGMISFVNRHMSPYQNCIQMLRHYFTVCFFHYFWPLQPLAAVMIPMTLVSIVLGFRAFSSPNCLEKDDDSPEFDNT